MATSTGPQTMVPPNPLPPVKNLILRRYGDLWGGSAKTNYSCGAGEGAEGVRGAAAAEETGASV